MYAREDAASTIIALLYELSKNLRTNPDSNAIRVCHFWMIWNGRALIVRLFWKGWISCWIRLH
jgi:hypothetical protein